MRFNPQIEVMSDDLRNRGGEAAPSKFTKKPVTIEAIQWTGKNAHEILTWITGGTAHHDGSSLFIETLEGTHEAGPGDWIIKGVKGEFYPCKPDIFEATYSDAALADMSDDLRNRVARAINPEAFEFHDTCLGVWERRKETALKAADAVLAHIVEAVAAEREACERVANDARTRNTVYEKARRDAAEAIRARGDTDALAARDKRVKDEALREALPVAAALAAAISLLDRTRQQAPSDKMFEQMVADYERALGDFRALIDRTAEGKDDE